MSGVFGITKAWFVTKHQLLGLYDYICVLPFHAACGVWMCTYAICSILAFPVAVAKIPQQKPLAGEGFSSNSEFQGAVLRGGEVLSAEAGGRWSHCVSNPEAENRGVFVQIAVSSKCSPGSGLRDWCHPSLVWISLSQLA